jgi:hypothetical protein
MSGNVAQKASDSAPGGSRSSHVEEAQNTELPPVVAELSAEYDRCIGDRDEFLWKWIHNLFDAFTLPCVPSEHWETVKETKTMLTMYVTVLDDLADRHGDSATFEQARRIPLAPEAVRPDAPGVDAETIEFAVTLWSHIEERLADAPEYDDYVDIFRFDVRQVLNAMEYGWILNKNRHMSNIAESRQFGPYNMVMFPYADVDLMWSPAFDRSELGKLRSLLLDLQQMARIGNWITTWERELYEGDYTAGVVVKALERGIIAPDEDPDDAIEAIEAHGIAERLDSEWTSRYVDASTSYPNFRSFDVGQLFNGMRTVMDHHVASRGHK